MARSSVMKSSTRSRGTRVEDDAPYFDEAFYLAQNEDMRVALTLDLECLYWCGARVLSQSSGVRRDAAMGLSVGTRQLEGICHIDTYRLQHESDIDFI